MNPEDVEPHVVRLREDASGWRRVDGPRLTQEDPFLAGLEESEAEALVRSNWALQRSSVEDAREFYPEEDEGEEEQEAEELPEPEPIVDDEAGEPAEWENWNEDDWLDMGYQQRTDDVEAGRVDDHLDEIEAVETSQNVKDAVDARRSELEG